MCDSSSPAIGQSAFEDDCGIVLGVTILSDVAVLVIYNINRSLPKLSLRKASTTAARSGAVLLRARGRHRMYGGISPFFDILEAIHTPEKLLLSTEQAVKHVCLFHGPFPILLSKFTAPWIDALLTCMMTGIILTNFRCTKLSFTA